MSYRTFDRLEASIGAAGSWKRWLCCACCTDALAKVGMRSATVDDETVIYRTVIVSSRSTRLSSSSEAEEDEVETEQRKVYCKVNCNNCVIHAEKSKPVLPIINAEKYEQALPVKLVISRPSSSSSSSLSLSFSEEEKSSTNTVIEAEKDPVRPSRLRARPTPVYIPSSCYCCFLKCPSLKIVD